MSTSMILTLILYAFGMACGQILFKLAAIRPAALALAYPSLNFVNVYLCAGVFLYGVLTLFWIWILRSIPLSKAYPFVALSFLFTPILSALMFGEILSPKYFAGLALIGAGIIVTVYP